MSLDGGSALVPGVGGAGQVTSPFEMLGSNWVRGAGSKGRNKY